MPNDFCKNKVSYRKTQFRRKVKNFFNSSEAKINVPKSLKELNYKVVTINDIDENNFYIIIEK